MNAGNWITIASVIIVVTGWFINGWLNRKHEIFKKRTDFRLEMFNSYSSYAFTLEKLIDAKNTDDKNVLGKELIERLEEAQAKILLYGTQKEVDLINKIITCAQSNSHLEMRNATASLMRLISENIRSQLGLKKIRYLEFNPEVQL